MLQRIFYLLLAGGLGTLARYGVAGLVQRLTTAAFPWGTLAVNVFGCFVTGVLWSLFEHRWPVAGQTRIVLLIGFMGGFTTFSSYILETAALLDTGSWFPAAGNVLLQNAAGLAALFAGAALGSLI